ncbi:hypothetical protein [Olivibacter sitiensis]|uniref:hypothetical protein n=1 Tax=Olivibacter sitiensis TaxID=376470 RepID=UPI0003FE3E79|nr:hypothetical protein [Olivibacter sitiensis]
MEKPTLDPNGVQQVLAALYALPDAALQTEADTLAADFQGWLHTHFELTAEQGLFIDTKMTVGFLGYVATHVPYVLVHRLPIHYTVPPDALATRDERRGKIIKGSDHTEHDTPEETKMAANPTGYFEFRTEYIDS